MARKLSWGISVLIAVDQLANSILAGSPDETISSRAYRCGVLDENPKKRWRIARVMIDTLFFWDKDHCKEAYESEQKRTHL